MGSLLETPGRALLVGIVITILVLLLWAVVGGLDPVGFLSYLLRFLHTMSAMSWVGLIMFVNFVQLAAVAEASGEGRATLMKSIVPRVGAGMRHASHATVVTGIVLLILSGYLLDRYVFATAVYMPPLRNLLLWGGTAAGLAMWGFLNLRIWPALRILTGETVADDAAQVEARAIVKTYARLNLVLAIPVTAVMVAAAHLY